jgi:glycosyltransferase involved in cell wall biosynthesis
MILRFEMKKKQIAIFPYEIKSNKYIDLIKVAYEKLDLCVVPFVGWRSKEYNYIALNWYESVQDLRIFIRRIIILIKLIIEKKDIIWTIHNKEPHDIKNHFFSRILIMLLFHISYKIIVHSKSTIGIIKQFNYKKEILKKIVFVPHPNYIDLYGKIDNNNIPDNDKLHLLFIGQIRPYKNIELLIEAVKELKLPNLKLKICGHADISYQDYLNGLIGSNNAITVDFNFIEDENISNLIAASHLLVLPYNLESSLNSGTIILSFSYKRTVLSPLIGTLRDIDDKTFFFSYEYQTIDEHKVQLKKHLLCIYQNYEDNYNELLKLGEKCYVYTRDNNSIESTFSMLREVIKK